MQGLKGEYRHKLDSKGRVSLPAGFRKVLPDKLVITISPEDNCLMVFTQEDYEEWLDSLFAQDGGYNSRNPQHRVMRLVINKRTEDTNVDVSGRIGIPPVQRELLGTDSEVLLIGDTDHLEIWDAKRLDEQVAQVDLRAWYNQS